MSDRDSEFREFAASRADRLQSFAYLCCGDWHRAQDTVQRALLKMYLAWDRTLIRDVDAYVRRVIVNTLVDDGRLSWFQRVGLTDRVPEMRPPQKSGCPETRMALVQALLTVPRRQRAAVILRYWDDLSIEDTARIMGCSTGAAKKLALRGLTTLRERLGDRFLCETEGTRT